MALTRIGALPVLINYNYKSIELKDITCYADLEFLLYGDGYKKIKYIDLIDSINFKQIPNFKACFDIGEKRFSNWMNNYKDFDPSYYSIIDSNIDTHDNLNMIFTSGTTSKVKGVVLTHYQMLNISNLQIESLRWTEEDVVCLPLPFFHCFGLSCGLLASLNKNLQLCLTSTRSLPILQTIEKYRCTVLNGVPSMYKSLMNNKDFDSFDLTSLKSGIIAGECVSPKNFKEISERCHLPYLQQSYGQTETSPAITFTEYGDPVSLRGRSVGKVIDGLELRIFDNDMQCEVASGVVGEIQVKGFNVLKNGYYNLKEENVSLYTKDNWLRTGDAGYLDENSYLFLTGRFKEMIIKNGENICPSEIENIILNFHGIQQVKVLGVCDDFSGEAIAAAYRSTEDSIEKELIEFVKKHLADYKVPKYFIRLEDFPALENGKIDTKKIKQIILNKLM